MIILGIDPGTTQIGFGIIKNEKGKFECLKYGLIKNPGKDKLADFRKTEKELDRLIEKYRPDICGIEKLFFFSNQKTVMAVSEMRGVILLTLSKKGIPVSEFTPLEIKQGVSGYGRADKNQVQKMTKMILGIKEDIRPDDAADALAIAVCAAGSYNSPF